MAYIDQFSALTRRKRRPNRVAIINRQAQNLPELLDLKGQREQREKLYDLDVKTLGLETKTLDLETKKLASTTAYQTDLLKIQKKNAELAKDLGYTNLGITTAFELAKTETGKKVGSAIGKGLGSIWEGILGLFT